MLCESFACVVGLHWVSHPMISILTCMICATLTMTLVICMKKMLTFTSTRLHANAQLGSDAPRHVLAGGGLPHLESESSERLFFTELSLLGRCMCTQFRFGRVRGSMKERFSIRSSASLCHPACLAFSVPPALVPCRLESEGWVSLVDLLVLQRCCMGNEPSSCGGVEYRDLHASALAFAKHHPSIARSVATTTPNMSAESAAGPVTTHNKPNTLTMRGLMACHTCLCIGVWALVGMLRVPSYCLYTISQLYKFLKSVVRVGFRVARYAVVACMIATVVYHAMGLNALGHVSPDLATGHGNSSIDHGTNRDVLIRGVRGREWVPRVRTFEGARLDLGNHNCTSTCALGNTSCVIASCLDHVSVAPCLSCIGT